jgi:hypothetical protein
MRTCITSGGFHLEDASQAAEKRFPAVILSEAKNLALRIFTAIRDSSSPAAPQNDGPDGFFRSLFTPPTENAPRETI